MLGLVPVPEPNAWIGELAGAYLIAGDYLGPCEAARGRAFDRDAWISALLALHPRDQYLYQLAALNHATNDLALLDEYQQRFNAAALSYRRTNPWHQRLRTAHPR